ncbi:MAG: tetratricopeptide repeat protein [Deltaproteobacteria bacterium]|nr:tetratricopeptide repeat protein [Deltaproteobacteria bacterium]
MVRKTRRKPRQNRKAFWLIILLSLGAFSVVWWVWPGLYSVSPRFDSMLLQKNDERLRLLNGDTLSLHPHDRIQIIKLTTSISFNIGVRLFASGLDINALTHEKLSIANLLPKGTSNGERRFRVRVMHRNQDLGHIDILVRPFVEDWLEKAERMIEPARKIEVLEEALKTVPQDRRIKARLIEEYCSLQKWPEAARLLEAMFKDKPDPRILSDLVEVYEAMNHTAGLLSSLKRLLEIQPGDDKIRLRYASTLEKAGRSGEALVQYEELLRRVEGEEKLPLHKTLGYIYSRIGENPRAIQHYEKALELDSGDPNLYYNLSSLYDRVGDEEKSNFCLREAIRLRPEDDDGRMRLSEHLLSRGRPEEAEKYLAEVLQRNPNSMKALLLMSHIAEKRKETTRLKEVYSRILSQDPGNENVMYNLGVLEYESGNQAGSLPYLEKYAMIHPEDPTVHGFLFNIYRELKKDDLAFKEARTLVTLNPNDAEPYHFLFKYLNNRGDDEGILEVMKSGVQSLPENLDLRKYMVFAYLKTGREGLAIDQMKEMVKITPNDVTLLLQLARLQEEQAKNTEAMETYRKILAVSPGHEEAGEAYLRLRLKGLPGE